MIVSCFVLDNQQLESTGWVNKVCLRKLFFFVSMQRNHFFIADGICLCLCPPTFPCSVSQRSVRPSPASSCPQSAWMWLQMVAVCVVGHKGSPWLNAHVGCTGNMHLGRNWVCLLRLPLFYSPFRFRRLQVSTTSTVIVSRCLVHRQSSQVKIMILFVYFLPASVDYVFCMHCVSFYLSEPGVTQPHTGMLDHWGLPPSGWIPTSLLVDWDPQLGNTTMCVENFNQPVIVVVKGHVSLVIDFTISMHLGNTFLMQLHNAVTAALYATVSWWSRSQYQRQILLRNSGRQPVPVS